MILLINTGISGRGEHLITYFSLEPKMLYLQFHTNFVATSTFSWYTLSRRRQQGQNDIYIDILITHLQGFCYSGTRRCISRYSVPDVSKDRFPINSASYLRRTK